MSRISLSRDHATPSTAWQTALFATWWRAVPEILDAHLMSIGRFAMLSGISVHALQQYDDVGLLCRPNWLPDAPIDLGELALRWVEDPPVPPIILKRTVGSGTAAE